MRSLLLAAADFESENMSILKWIAIYSMILNLIVGAHWLIYLRKENTRDNIIPASAKDLEDYKEQSAKNHHDAELRLIRLEATEKQTGNLLTKMDKTLESMGTTIRAIAHDVAKIEGQMEGTRP